jgi:hypothetical protein
VATALLPPVLLVLVVDTLLGPERNYRRGIFLVPLVLAAAAARLGAQAGIAVPGPSFSPELAGAAATVLLCLWVRGAVPPTSEGVAS